MQHTAKLQTPMPSPSRRFSPNYDSGPIQVAARPSLYDNREDFIDRVAPIGMAAIYFGSFSLAPQDAALSRQALFKLSFVHRNFLSPAGLKIGVQHQTATFFGNVASRRLIMLGEILAQQIEGVAKVINDTDGNATLSSPDSIQEAAQLIFATDQTLRTGIRLSQENGRLVLEGEVLSATQKTWAELLVASVGGDLDSRLQVTPLPATEPAKAPDVDDESLQALILFRLRLVRETEHLHLRIKATRGVVTLQGKVRTEMLRQRVENIARSTLGLRELRSSLTIVP